MVVSKLKKLLIIVVTIFCMLTFLCLYWHKSVSLTGRIYLSGTVINHAPLLNDGDNRMAPIVSKMKNTNETIQSVSGPIIPNSVNLEAIGSNIVNVAEGATDTLLPIDDFVKYPCVKEIPLFPTSSWPDTGKCVRMFNDTKTASELNVKCVPLRTNRGTTPICVYDAFQDHFISQSLLKSGQWEGSLVDNVLEALNNHPDSEFLDLGCNIGTYTLAAANLGRKVVAVDAVIENLELLSKSLTLGKHTDKVIPVWNAISDDYSKVTLTTYKGNVGGTAIRNLTTEDRKKKETFITQTIRLDDLVPLFQGKTVVIKMDIETKEYNALLGATHFFDVVDIPMIQMEINWHRPRESGPKIVSYLATRNLTAFADPRGKKPLNVSTIKSWPGDVYFLKSIF